jgi:alkyl hydroperoxide reductase subunit AhpF
MTKPASGSAFAKYLGEMTGQAITAGVIYYLMDAKDPNRLLLMGLVILIGLASNIRWHQIKQEYQ